MQARIHLEKYIGFNTLTSGGSSSRSHILKRIETLSKEKLLDSFKWDGIKFDDSSLLMHLFCTFMDDQLSDEEYYQGQPFSKRYFITIDDKPTFRVKGSVFIQQTQLQPSHYQLIGNGCIYQSFEVSIILLNNNHYLIILYFRDQTTYFTL